MAWETGGLFVIDAETGDISQFTGFGINGTNSFTASVSQRNHGNYSFAQYMDATGGYCTGYKTISGSPSEIWIRAYIYLDPALILSSYSSYILLGANDSINPYSWNLICNMGPARRVGTSGFPEQLVANVNGSVLLETNFTWVPNRWYCLEMHYKAGSGTGELQAWVDGVSYFNLTGLDNDAYSIASVAIGDFGCNPETTNTTYLDDFKVSTTGYIGPYNATSGIFKTLVTVYDSWVGGVNKLFLSSYSSQQPDDVWFSGIDNTFHDNSILTIVNNKGEQEALERIIMKHVPGNGDTLTLRLFKNNVTIGEGDTWLKFTESIGTGYASKKLNGSSWRIAISGTGDTNSINYFGNESFSTSNDAQTFFLWNDNYNIVYKCPGVGSQRLKTLDINIPILGTGNIRCGIYDSTLNLVAQWSTASSPGSVGWYKITSFVDKDGNTIIPILNGGQNYYLVANGASSTHEISYNVVTSGYMKYVITDYTADFPDTIPGSPTDSSRQYAIRAGVEPNTDESYATYSQQTFTYTGGDTIYGYYVTTKNSAGDTIVLYANKFANGPYIIPSTGGVVKFTPIISFD